MDKQDWKPGCMITREIWDRYVADMAALRRKLERPGVIVFDNMDEVRRRVMIVDDETKDQDHG